MSRVLVAGAGSGKTQWIVEDAAAQAGQRVLITTYTRANTGSIQKRLERQFGVVPGHVSVASWFSFLLRDGVRPYQRAVSSQRVSTIRPISGTSKTYAKRGTKRYYLDGQGRAYTDKVSDLAVFIDRATNGAVSERIRRVYGSVYIDEAQDMAGYDLDFVEGLMRSGVRVVLVGDPRQSTYVTTQARKNRKYRGEAITDKFREWHSEDLCDWEDRSFSWRCNQKICNVADTVFTGYAATESRNLEVTGHDGVFSVREEHLAAYVARFAPQGLRYDRRTNARGVPAMNFGYSKGLEFDRVLILPNKGLRKWLETGDGSKLAASTASKLYVAVTRARSSVAFLHDGGVGIDGIEEWVPE